MKHMQWLGTTLAVLAIVSLCIATTGCNTLKGAGKDIEKGGEKLQDAAD